MPLAVSATTFRCRRLAVSTNEWTCATKSSSRSSSLTATAKRARVAPLEELGGRRLDLGQPAVDADGACPRQTELDAVVRRRIVRRGEHRPGGVEPTGGEVQQVRRREAEVHDVDTLAAHSVSKGGCELDA